MKKEELFEVLGNLEPGMVEKARSDPHPRRGVWKKSCRICEPQGKYAI